MEWFKQNKNSLKPDAFDRFRQNTVRKVSDKNIVVVASFRTIHKKLGKEDILQRIFKNFENSQNLEPSLNLHKKWHQTKLSVDSTQC